jgi:hypothetical protein
VLFHEVQPLRQRHTRIVLAVPPAALLFIAVRQIAFHSPWTHPTMSNADLIFLSILLVAVYVRLITVRLVTELRAAELFVGLRGLWRMRRVPLTVIHSARAVRYDPVSDYHGYGVRSGTHGLGYIAYGNRGVEMELADGTHLLVGSQRPEELAAKILQSRDASNSNPSKR